MDPLLLGALVAAATVLVLFSGVSVAIGLLIVSAGQSSKYFCHGLASVCFDPFQKQFSR